MILITWITNHISCDNLSMRSLLITLLTTYALAQSPPRILISHTTESLRGVSAVSKQVAWASGTHGTYLHTTDGNAWQPAQVPGAESLDFRAVVAFSADEAFLMSAGPGDQSRIYHTTDAGEHWQLQFTNTNPKGFFDSMAFWDGTHGIVLGDPIPDESGDLKFELLLTDDGQTWHHLPPANLPPAIEGEGAFAASNTCIAILPASLTSGNTPRSQKASHSNVIPNARQRERDLTSASGVDAADRIAQRHALSGKSGASAPRNPSQKQRPSAPDPNIWFATGGKAARVFHSPDRGKTWQVADTPVLHGPDSAGIFSIAFRDTTHGVIAGGDYKNPNQDGPNLAFSEDGGRTWTLSKIHPQAYFSAVAYDRGPRNQATVKDRVFIVGQDFIFDFRPPAHPTRIGPKKKPDTKFNALSPYPQGGALIVGPKGTIAATP
ncbi:MAG: hypothetical protein LAO24_19380 [Acidobacteriia bacterium]|nr:hypothetical protein [Terriglobia bacterium]